MHFHTFCSPHIVSLLWIPHQHVATVMFKVPAGWLTFGPSSEVLVLSSPRLRWGRWISQLLILVFLGSLPSSDVLITNIFSSPHFCYCRSFLWERSSIWLLFFHHFCWGHCITRGSLGVPHLYFPQRYSIHRSLVSGFVLTFPLCFQSKLSN